MNRQRKDQDTSTTEFEVDGIEEAFAPAPSQKVARPGEPFKLDTPKLEIETPPELMVKPEYEAKIWILERRARGLIARLRRWIVGVEKGPSKAKSKGQK
jgi:hypothetical protein